MPCGKDGSKQSVFSATTLSAASELLSHQSDDFRGESRLDPPSPWQPSRNKGSWPFSRAHLQLFLAISLFSELLGLMLMRGMGSREQESTQMLKGLLWFNSCEERQSYICRYSIVQLYLTLLYICAVYMCTVVMRLLIVCECGSLQAHKMNTIALGPSCLLGLRVLTETFERGMSFHLYASPFWPVLFKGVPS